MEFDILGPLAVRRSGVSVDVGSLKQRALVIVLLLDLGRAVPIDRLIDDLWSGRPPPRALVTLRSYVSNVRRALEGPARSDPVLVTRGKGYALDVAPDSLDAVRFERLVQQARDDREAGKVREALAALDAALALWRGEALADVAYEDFAQGHITRLEELRLTAHEERFDALLAAGRHIDAVPGLEAFIAGQPLRERPHAQLMTAFYRSGRAGDALRVYRGFREALLDEMGLDPSPSLERLADRILHREADLDAAPAPVFERAPVVAPVAAAPAAAPSPASLTLIGRRAEQQRLAAATARAAGGSGGMVLIGGEPGIGKTALLEDLAAVAAAQGAAVVWGRCYETEGAPAFWPWVSVVRAVCETLDDGELARAAADVAEPITQLVDEVAERIGRRSTTAGVSVDVARFALFEAVTTFLRRIAETRPLAVLLEDIHWADTASLQLLAFLVAQLPASRLLVAASYRDLPAARSEELEATLATVARERCTEQISVRGLPRDDVRQLVAQVTGDEAPDDMVAVIHERTAGNPFFVRQLAPLLEQSATSGGAGDGLASIPLGVRHAIGHRLHLLPTDARQVLGIAAVVGRTFDIRVVAAAAGLDLDMVLDAVDAGVDHGLVEGSAAPVTEYRFVHALIRETLYDGFSPARAARLHAEVGRALEQLPGISAAELAEHFFRAADVISDTRPLDYLVRAADEALAVFAWEQAESSLRRALDLAVRHRDAGAELGVRLRLIQLLSGTRGWSAEEFLHVASRVRQLAEVSGVEPELVPLWWSLWVSVVTQGDLVTGLDLATKLLHDAEAHDDPGALLAGHVCVAYTRCLVGAPLAEILEHANHARRYLELAPEAAAAVPEHIGVSVRVAEALARLLAGDTDRALAVMRDGVDLAIRLQRPFSEVYARLFAGWFAAVGREPAAVLDATGPALALCERYGFRHIANLTIPSDSWARVQLGEDAAAHAEKMIEAIDAVLSVGHRHAAAQWLILLADVLLAADDVAQAQRRLAEARSLVAETGERIFDAQLHRLEARLLTASGPAPAPAAGQRRRAATTATGGARASAQNP